MTNKMAMDTVRKMKRDGLDPTPEDVVRINAFGLRVDEAQGKRADDAAATLPRVAVLVYPQEDRGRLRRLWSRISHLSHPSHPSHLSHPLSHPSHPSQLSFRQPTVGHEIWLKSAMRFADAHDYETLLALNCFALSRPSSELPDALDPDAVRRAAARFAKDCAPFTKEQLYAAISYVRFGMDPADGEKPPTGNQQPQTSNLKPQTPSPESCVAVASLVDGVSVLWGMSLEDIKALTREQLDKAVRVAIVAHGMRVGKEVENRAIDEFNEVVEEIRARLTSNLKPQTSNS